MARYNEILVGRFARSLQKLFGHKGEVPVGSLAGEVQSVHNFFSGVENRYLESWERFGFAIQIAAGGAGVFTGIRLRNPAGSNVIIVVEKAFFSSSGVDEPNLESGVISTDLTNVPGGASLRFDARGRPNATGIFSWNPAASVPQQGTDRVFAKVLANTYVDFVAFEEQEMPVLPGEGIQLRQGVANLAIDAGFWWRERFLEESERA